jgi:threonine/homoserine/homoserine lactone efflux protein
VAEVLGFALAGIALAGTPGPATLSLAAAGAAFGWRPALAYGAGITIGMAPVMGAVAAGLAGLLLALPGVAPLLLGFAVAYFLYLAFRIATAPPLAASGAARRPPAFLGGLFLSLVNPKGWAAMAALFSGFVLAPGRPLLDAAAKTLLLLTIIAAVNLAWLAAGTALAGRMRDPRASRAVNLAFALLLLAALALALLL